jgi:hypothetical protein
VQQKKKKAQINEMETKFNKIKDEKGDTTTDTNEIQIIREYFENLYSRKLENQEEINKK